MRVLVWLVEGTWEACVDAARDLGVHDITLLYVTDADMVAAMSGPVGLLGRSGPAPAEMLTEAGHRLLDAAAQRLGRPAGLELRDGRPEHAVVAACAGADLLVLARDGDRSRPGPRSLGHATRFVVDHAPCGVLLVWPEDG